VLLKLTKYYKNAYIKNEKVVQQKNLIFKNWGWDGGLPPKL